jgi:hypothetical protein
MKKVIKILFLSVKMFEAKEKELGYCSHHPQTLKKLAVP